LAVTLGDAAGSGPELITKGFADPEVRAVCRPIVIGDAGAMRAALGITRVPSTVRVIAKPEEAGDDPAVINVIDLQNLDAAKLVRGQVSATTGKAAYEAIKRAVELTQAKQTAAIVTSAINKAALHAAGYKY